MFFDWLKTRRRRKLLAAPMPASWRSALEENVRLYGRLTTAEQAKVCEFVHIFVVEKNWEGCGGLTLTDEMKVVIAAQVGILVVGFEPIYFDAVLSVLIYPENYLAPKQSVVRGGIVVEEDSARMGEAWYRGPVILSWPEALASAQRRNRGQNVVLHEFAHQLDMLNGRSADGVPPMKAEPLRRWNEVNGRYYKQLVDACAEGRGTPLDHYGATNRAEFFAVATEAFFESPQAMQRQLPELYEVFREFYRQDPAKRESAA